MSLATISSNLLSSRLPHTISADRSRLSSLSQQSPRALNFYPRRPASLSSRAVRPMSQYKEMGSDVPGQNQEQPGLQSKMDPAPMSIRDNYKPAGKLKGKVALITGGDSGIGRAVAVHYAAEGAKVAFTYLSPKEDPDADECVDLVLKHGGHSEDAQDWVLKIRSDLADPRNCEEVVKQVVDKFGRIDILVNNIAEQHVHESLEEVTSEELDRTFATNIKSAFLMTKHSLRHMGPGSTIINTASVEAYMGNPGPIPYSATKGAIVSFTRSLSLNLSEKDIRVNGVAPGPIWTPIIVGTFAEEKVEEEHKQFPMKRYAQPGEIAPTWVFLASEDASYFSGQILHPNGGMIING